MSQETLNTILSGIAALTGLVAVGIALHQILQHRKDREEDRRTAEEQRRRAEEQLALARQHSEMRPDLEVSVALKPYGRNHLELGVLEVEVYNSGKVAANDVHGRVHFEASKLSPYDPWDQPGRRMLRPYVGRSWGSSCEEEQEPRNGYYEGQFWENDRLLPGTYRTFRFYVTKMRKGESEVLYSAVSSEGAKVDASVPIEVS
jgi:hypothetical protein